MEAVRVPEVEGGPTKPVPVPRATPQPRFGCTRPAAGDEAFAPPPWADDLNNNSFFKYIKDFFVTAQQIERRRRSQMFVFSCS